MATRSRETGPFRHLHPRNPLRQLPEDQKIRLLAILRMYLGSPANNEVSSLLEKAAGLAKDAGALGREIRSELLEAPLESRASELAEVLSASFADLPERLEEFSNFVGATAEKAGKRGHKGRMARNQWLIAASVLVRLQTGNYQDEHVAELLQALIQIGTSNGDISGESIRKKRKYFLRQYPELFRGIFRNLTTILASRISDNKASG